MTESADYVISACRENDVKFIRLWFTDIVGALKSFAITVEELEKALEEGMGFDGSSIEGFARIDESDMVARPDPATFQLVPWRPRESGVARMFCDIHHPDGTAFEGDPRQVLKRQLKRAADLGYTFYVSPEMEYFYFKRFAERPVPARPRRLLRPDLRCRERPPPRDRPDPRSHGHRSRVQPPRSGPEPARDRAPLHRCSDDGRCRDDVPAGGQGDRHYQRRSTPRSCPSRSADQNGSGMHVHQSLFKGERNAFFDVSDEYHLSAIARGYIAGLLHNARALTLGHEPVGQ
jgi:glutamine synthetase